MTYHSLVQVMDAGTSNTLDTYTRFHPLHQYLLLSEAIFWEEERYLEILPEHVVYERPWLHYDESSYVVFCSVCQRYNAMTRGRFASGSKDMPFLSARN